jgi:hypothetical protein
MKKKDLLSRVGARIASQVPIVRVIILPTVRHVVVDGNIALPERRACGWERGRRLLY